MTTPPDEPQGEPGEQSGEPALPGATPTPDATADSTADPSSFDWQHPDFVGQRTPSRHRPHSERHGAHPRSGSSRSHGRSHGRSHSRARRLRRRWRRWRRKWRRPRNVLLTILLVLIVVVGGYGFYLNGQLSRIGRSPMLANYAGQMSSGTNVLLVGSEAPGQSLVADARTIVIQLVHLSEDGSHAAVVQFPRDLYLSTPTADPQTRDLQTLENTYQAGGNPLLVRTLQDDLGLRIDHVAQVSFDGYVAVTDRIGGVIVPTAQGQRHFAGKQMLAYADATTGLVNGDVDTGNRHQQWLKQMLAGSLTPGMLINPVHLIGLLRDTTGNLVVDDTFTNRDMRHLMWDARHLRPSAIRYLTAPFRKFAHRPRAGRVLLPQRKELRQLGQALRTDDEAGVATFDN